MEGEALESESLDHATLKVQDVSWLPRGVLISGFTPIGTLFLS